MNIKNFKLSPETIICSCFKKDLNDINEAIKSIKNKDYFMEELIEKTFAGKGCMRCISPQYDLNNRKEIYLSDFMEH